MVSVLCGATSTKCVPLYLDSARHRPLYAAINIQSNSAHTTNIKCFLEACVEGIILYIYNHKHINNEVLQKMRFNATTRELCPL